MIKVENLLRTFYTSYTILVLYEKFIYRDEDNYQVFTTKQKVLHL